MPVAIEEITPLAFERIGLIDQWPELEYDEEFGIDRYEHYRRLDALGLSVEQGIMPRTGNGYSFVIDMRPEGQENAYIPSLEYTQYFSNQQIPISAPGHNLFDHDIGHIPSYQIMFNCADFANMVQAAATNALTDPERCRTFTGAMDGFGDCMRSLTEGSRYEYNVTGARYQLERLLSLLPTSETEAPDHTALFNTIWSALSLNWYQAYATRQPRSRYRYNTYYGLREYDIGPQTDPGLAELIARLLREMPAIHLEVPTPTVKNNEEPAIIGQLVLNS